MTGALEIKVTISEIATPTLFDALVAISNPRQRAALLALSGRCFAGSVQVPRAGVTSTPTSANASATTKAARGPAPSEATPSLLSKSRQFRMISLISTTRSWPKT